MTGEAWAARIMLCHTLCRGIEVAMEARLQRAVHIKTVETSEARFVRAAQAMLEEVAIGKSLLLYHFYTIREGADCGIFST